MRTHSGFRTRWALAPVAGLLMLLAACTPSQTDMALGTTKEFAASDAAVALSVDDIRAATSDEITELGLKPAPDKVLWFVTYKIALTKGEVASLDAAQVYPADDAWTGETDRGGEVKQTKVMGSGFDCTKDKSGTAGISKDAPLISCLVFQTGPKAVLESVTVGDHGTWTTKP